ncbi:hypothetical protein RND71_027905 [Anisodus tanguticus]|uniref:non-specific serine/threonine protein kinase n=1 Tax=Anisodus tanguticus TaxID=243964 RepID=A0AAE1V262_9SOLA|nr:hypothetical protein RND71_027905 [Anisodus tanguticus]
MQICHRDLKLENTLLDGSAAPRVKICDFGYSKSSVFHSQPKSTVGTPAYVAPEILTRKEYDGKMFGHVESPSYPFQDASDPKNFTKTIACDPIPIEKITYIEEVPLVKWTEEEVKRMEILENIQYTIFGKFSHDWPEFEELKTIIPEHWSKRIRPS